jgi:hypothetical protein
VRLIVISLPKLALQREGRTPELRILKIDSEDWSNREKRNEKSCRLSVRNLFGVVGCDFNTRKNSMVIGRFA